MPIKYKNDSLASLNAAYAAAQQAHQNAKSDLDPLYKFADALAKRGQIQAALESERERVKAGKIGAMLDYLASRERNAAAQSTADAQFKMWLKANQAQTPPPAAPAAQNTPNAELDPSSVFNGGSADTAPAFTPPNAPTDTSSNEINAGASVPTLTDAPAAQPVATTLATAASANSNLPAASEPPAAQKPIIDTRPSLAPKPAPIPLPSSKPTAPIYDPRQIDGKVTRTPPTTLSFR